MGSIVFIPPAVVVVTSAVVVAAVMRFAQGESLIIYLACWTRNLLLFPTPMPAISLTQKCRADTLCTRPAVDTVIVCAAFVAGLARVIGCTVCANLSAVAIELQDG